MVFDCDGVVLNSNQLKIQAYYDTAIAFGGNDAQATALVAHHVMLGGISRYPKFEYFIQTIMQQTFTDEAMQRLLQLFNQEVERLLSTCDVADGLEQLRNRHPHQRWMILSGGDQAEIRKLFSLRDIATYFNAGIFGSPDNKDQVLARELSAANITQPALFIGDSRYDHQAATRAGLDFVFMSAWTDFEGWPTYCEEHAIHVQQKISDFL